MAERETKSSWLQPGHHGAATSGVTLAEAKIAAAWNVQGDAERTSFTAEFARQFGVALPVAANTATRTDSLAALWLGPRSWLLIARGASTLNDFAATRETLNAAGGALFDVSASRVAWTISGPHAPTVLATGCPLDFHPRAFPPGTCAQSLYGHLGALIARHRDAPAFTLMVARSYARDAWHALLEAGAQYGVEVLPPAAYR